MNGKTLLYLEDDKELQTLVTAYLNERGYQVESARTAQEAFKVLERQGVDAAIVDGLLPGMPGTEFIQKLRQTQPNLPVLFASAFWKDLKSREVLLRELRVARILQKPYTPQELFVWVEQVLAPQKRSPPPRKAVEEAAPLSKELADELAALRAEYGARLPEKLAALAAALSQARGGSREAVAVAYGLAHKLHGSAGSFGFAALGMAAGRLEALIRAAREAEAPPDWDAIERALREVVATPSEPVKAPGQAQGPQELTPAPSPAPNPAALGTLGTVLVADTDEAYLAEMEKLGRERMVRVLTARSVEEALERVRGQWLDGALLHVHLGGPEGGFAAAALLRGEPGLQSLPLAFFSEDMSFSHRVAAIHAGASLYLPRPFSALDFTSAVERMVAARRPERSRVLVVDDDEDALRALTRVVADERVEVVSISDPYRLVEALSEHRPDLLLLDVEMPGPSGFDLCRILRAMPEWQQLPVLFVTTHVGVEFRVAAFQAGADDYLTKPVLREELLARMHSRLERARLARDQAERDALTGLLLRRPFLEGLRAHLAESKRRQEPVAVCFLDVDHFKRVNDNYGHLAGDRVLTRLGRLLLSRFRKEDVRGRWGGEEFVLALSGTTAEHAREIVGRTARELEAMEFEGDKGERFHITFSGGIAEAPKDGLEVETLLRIADERLFRAKAAGRNRIEI